MMHFTKPLIELAEESNTLMLWIRFNIFSILLIFLIRKITFKLNPNRCKLSILITISIIHNVQ